MKNLAWRDWLIITLLGTASVFSSGAALYAFVYLHLVHTVLK